MINQHIIIFSQLILIIMSVEYINKRIKFKVHRKTLVNQHVKCCEHDQQKRINITKEDMFTLPVKFIKIIIFNDLLNEL